MDTEVIILAQGPLNRLAGRFATVSVPGAVVAALLPEHQPLPGCGGARILTRTIRQAFHMTMHAAWPTVVSWHQTTAVRCCGATVLPANQSLSDPGNSALKGIARYLELREEQGRRYAHTIVLLGDVVYSWACLEAIWKMSQACGFVGTRDLAMDKGELWGVAWARSYDGWMLPCLGDALLRHPPVDDEYLPGQLRRWVSGMKRGDLRNHVTHLRHRVPCGYFDIDDYTHDIDAPSDLVLLPELSLSAADDDAKHGMAWNQEENMKGA